MSKRVHELAKEINRNNKDILNVLKNKGVVIQSHMSMVSDENIEFIKKYFGLNASDSAKQHVEINESQMVRAQSRQVSSNQNVSVTGNNTNNTNTNNRTARNSQSQTQSSAVQNNNLNKSTQNQNSNNTATNNNIQDNSNNRYNANQVSNQRRNNTNQSSGQNRNNTATDNSSVNNNRNSSGNTNNNRNNQNTNNNRYNNNVNRNNSNNSNTNNMNSNGNNNNNVSNNSTNNNYANRNSNGNNNNTGNNSTNNNYTNRNNNSNTGNNSTNNNYNNRSNNNNTGNNSTNNNYTNRNSNSNTGNNSTNNNYTNRNSNSNTSNNGVNNNYNNRNSNNNNVTNNTNNSNANNNNSTNYNNRNNSNNNNSNSSSNNNVSNSGSNNNYNNRNNNKNNNRNTNSNTNSTTNTNNNNGNTNNNYNNSNNNKGNNRNNNRNNNSNNRNSNNKNAIQRPAVQVQEVKEVTIKTIIIPEQITLKELADKIKIPAAILVKQLFLKGTIVTINQELSFDEAEEIALEYNCIAELEEKIDVIEELLKEDEEDEKSLKKRPPVVCVMGHVDHGKTSLLDAIRETGVAKREAGGITQHIGAYVVECDGENITFLDTPGHEAFTAMRMRGAKSTDIAILVVAADDGVMPQTVEAINHAKAAGIEIIVAINKIDKASANIERVKQELTEYELIAEDWGGSTVFVPVSAHTKEGIQQLLEMIILTAEICELKANPNRKARGIVIEAELDKGRGSVATILVQKGTLKVGDSIAVGASFGKVRAMIDDKGKRLKEAGPSTPVEIIGLNEVPFAGEVFMATESDKEARVIAQTFISHGREKLLDDTKAKMSLDDLFTQIKAGNVKELNIVVKADVQGSVEAVKQSLVKLSNSEVVIKIIHGGVGAINESDVILASASNAIIIGFNVRPDNSAKEIADREKVDLRIYRVIYNAIEDIEAAMKGMLDPTYEEKIQGHAEVRQIYKASGLGTIAGSYILDGLITKNSSVRLIRDGVVVFEGMLASLKRFKDDVKEVKTGYECGLVFEKFNDIKEGDNVEAYIMEEIPR